MKKIALALGAVFCMTANVYALDLPPISPGLWEITSTGQGQTAKSKHCIDTATMEKMLTKSSEMLGGACSKLSMKKTGAETYTSSVNCNMMGSQVSVKSILTGDFSSKYTSTTTTSFNPPMMGQSGGTSKDSAVRLGDCPSTMQPGDVQLADGSTINTQKMMKEMPNLGEMMNQMQGGEAPNPEQLQKLMEQMQKMQEAQQR